MFWVWMLVAGSGGMLLGLVAMALMSAGAAAQARQEGWEERAAFEGRRRGAGGKTPEGGMRFAFPPYSRMDSDDNGEPD